MLSNNGAIYTRTRTDTEGKFSFVVPPRKYSFGAANPRSKSR